MSYLRVLQKSGSQSVAFGMRDRKIHVRGIHPLAKRIGYRLGQRLEMRHPRKHHLGARLGLVFLNRDAVGQRLQRVARGRFEVHNRHTGILPEFVDHNFLVISLTVFQLGKCPHRDYVAVLPDHRRRFLYVFGLVAVHHRAIHHFQTPRILRHIHHHHFHAQVLGGLLGAEAGAQAGIEKQQPDGFVVAQVLAGKRIVFGLQAFPHQSWQIGSVLQGDEVFHRRKVFRLVSPAKSSAFRKQKSQSAAKEFDRQPRPARLS